MNRKENRVISKKYYIIKNSSGKYLIQHAFHDVYYFSEYWRKALTFSTEQKALNFMKIDEIKGAVYKVSYKESISS